MVSTRWGIISAGKISHDFVTCLRSLRDHEVVVVAAMNVTNARKFALLHKIEKVLDNYDDMAKQDNIGKSIGTYTSLFVRAVNGVCT